MSSSKRWSQSNCIRMRCSSSPITLPKRQAVWWALGCVKQGVPEMPPEQDAALKTTERWIAEPTEENRQAAFKRRRGSRYLDSRGHHGSGRILQRRAAADRRPEDERESLLHHGETRYGGCHARGDSRPRAVEAAVQRVRDQRSGSGEKDEGLTWDMPQSRVTDMHVCPMVTPGVPPIPHVGGPILPPCAVTVLVGAAAGRACDRHVRVRRSAGCHRLGSFTVLIMNLPAARIGDMTAHGGSIVMGMPTVLTG